MVRLPTTIKFEHSIRSGTIFVSNRLSWPVSYSNDFMSSGLMSLPAVILARIFGCLDSTGKGALSTSCKWLHEIVNTETLVALFSVFGAYNDISGSTPWDHGIYFEMFEKMLWVLQNKSVLVGFFPGHTQKGTDEILRTCYTPTGDAVHSFGLHWAVWRKEGVLWLILDAGLSQNDLADHTWDLIELNHLLYSEVYLRHECTDVSHDDKLPLMDKMRIASHVYWMEMHMSARCHADHSRESWKLVLMEDREKEAVHDGFLLEQCFREEMEEEVRERVEELEKEEFVKECRCYQEGSDAVDVEAYFLKPRCRGRGKNDKKKRQ